MRTIFPNITSTPLHIITLFTLLFSGCLFEPTDISSNRQHFAYGRFVLYYFPNDIATPHIEIAAQRKERILQSYEELLGMRYDTILPTYIVKESRFGRAYYDYNSGTITESIAYLLTDSGHEIAHAITIRMMGRAGRIALTEGMAVFMELRRGKVHDRYDQVRFLPRHKISVSYLLDLFAGTEEARENFSVDEYTLTGLFIDFLFIHHGIESIKALWYASIEYPEAALIDQFSSLFGRTFDQCATDFIALLTETLSRFSL